MVASCDFRKFVAFIFNEEKKLEAYVLFAKMLDHADTVISTFAYDDPELHLPSGEGVLEAAIGSELYKDEAFRGELSGALDADGQNAGVAAKGEGETAQESPMSVDDTPENIHN